ncbi:hypothetical protein PanWU01x14_136600 [Parasponia andersonii]|uniref:NAD(P)H dehydrogenase subunit CRR3, chloroplastic n=1 Tax=Parasponia andersonii TaxID=3476 RepID=A0A2P5CNX6_PARAD|nr:hypothetical protein PanWU01x14_136600 [Parasponia andersonii]
MALAASLCCSPIYMTRNLPNTTNGNGSGSGSVSPPPLQTHTLKMRVKSPSPTAPPDDAPLTTQKKPHRRHAPNPRQPSVIEIERAIGAGRDFDEEEDAKFDISTLNFPGKFEMPLQKKIRESSEWVTDRTERAIRLSGKKILMITIMWILPIWTFSLLVASGFIKLPFSNQFLDHLIT